MSNDFMMCSSSNLLAVVQGHPACAGLQFAPERGALAGGLADDGIDAGLDNADDGVVGAGALADSQVSGGDADGLRHIAHRSSRGRASSPQLGIHLCGNITEPLVGISV